MKNLVMLAILVLGVGCGKGPEGARMAECVSASVSTSTETLTEKATEILTRVENGCGAKMAALTMNEANELEGIFVNEVEYSNDLIVTNVVTIENGRFWSISVVDSLLGGSEIVASTGLFEDLPQALLDTLSKDGENLVTSRINEHGETVESLFEKRLPSLNPEFVESLPITLIDAVTGEEITE